MTARRGPVSTGKAIHESEALRLKGKIHELESILSNQDHPVFVPFLRMMNNRIIQIDEDLEEYEKRSEMDIKVLLAERLIVKRLIDFNAIEKSIEISKRNLEFHQKELIRGKKDS